MTGKGFFAPPVPRLIAHRGASRELPENTLAAFRRAAELGAEIIELDLHLSLDRVPVVIHDATLRRTTGARGLVSARTAEELRALDAGRRRGEGPRGEGVPALGEVLAALPATRFVVEVKTADPELDGALRAVLDETAAADRVLVAAHDGPLVRRLRRAFPDLPTNVARDEIVAYLRDGASTLPERARAFQVPPRHRSRALVTRAFVEGAHAAGREVHVWTVNDAPEMRALLDLGVDGIMTDVPDRLLQVYRERGVR